MSGARSVRRRDRSRTDAAAPAATGLVVRRARPAVVVETQPEGARAGRAQRRLRHRGRARAREDEAGRRLPAAEEPRPRVALEPAAARRAAQPADRRSACCDQCKAALLMDVRGFMHWLPMRLGYVWGPRVMSSLRRRWVYLRHPHANLDIHPTAYLGPGFS